MVYASRSGTALYAWVPTEADERHRGGKGGTVNIRKRATLVYLATALPLLLLGMALLYAWHDAQFASIEADRLNNARLVATSFETIVRDVSSASRVIGEATLASPPPSREPPQLERLARDFPLHFAAIEDRSGRIVYASDDELLGREIVDTAVWRARDGATFTLGNSREFEGRTGFFVAQALFGGDGGQAGVAIQFVDPTALGARLALNPIGGGAHVVDASGHLVVQYEFPELGATRPYWGGFPFIDRALKGQEAVDRNWIFPPTGERRIAAAVPIGDLGWEAASAIDREQALRPYVRSLILSLVAASIVVIGSGAGAALFIRSLVRGVRALDAQSRTVGKREVRPAAIVRTGDEIEQVSKALHEADIELRLFIDGLEAIGEAGRILSASLEPEQVNEAIIRAARRLFDARAVWIFLYDPALELLHTGLWYSERGTPAPEVAIRPGEGVAGRVFSSGEIAIIPDIGEAEGFSWRDATARGSTDSIVEMPLVRAGETFGVLGVYAPGVDRWQLGGREVGLLRAFGNEVSTVLQNARLYESERVVADTLQQALLTLPERVPGISFAHLYHSATRTARVGGDFYDLFEVGGRVGMVVGDVAGKGLDAAVMTSLVKNTVRAHAEEPDKSPARVVSLTNELMVKESRSDSFVTLLLGYLNVFDGTFAYCNAGHTTGLLLRANGRVEPLKSNSPLVGAFSGLAFEHSLVRLEPCDTLLFYTDGLTEARRGRDLFGERRLIQLASALESREAAVVVRHTLDAVLKFTSGELSDDLAVLAVQWLEPGDEPEGVEVATVRAEA